MKTITIVYDPARCCEDAESGDDDFDLFAMLASYLNDAGIQTEINLYDGDIRPDAEASGMLDMLERCRAALPDAWLAVKSNTPRELIDDLNALLSRHGR